MPHATSAEDVYQGRRVPHGTIVFPNLPALSRDAAVYGADADLFRPERFLRDELHANASAAHPDFRRRDHFHYGFGRRLCQGIFLAEASLLIVIARVLWAFEIGEVPGEPKLDLGDKIGEFYLLILSGRVVVCCVDANVVCSWAGHQAKTVQGSYRAALAECEGGCVGHDGQGQDGYPGF